MVKPLPPLNAIRAFEVASRHLNLSRAAEELVVTQDAISKQVIALEEFIGIQLFLREPSGLQLTAEGGNLKEAIAPAFTTLSDAFARYSRRPPRSNTIRISNVASFASNFLVPRLAPREFHRTLPRLRAGIPDLHPPRRSRTRGVRHRRPLRSGRLGWRRGDAPVRWSADPSLRASSHAARQWRSRHAAHRQSPHPVRGTE